MRIELLAEPFDADLCTGCGGSFGKSALDRKLGIRWASGGLAPVCDSCIYLGDLEDLLRSRLGHMERVHATYPMPFADEAIARLRGELDGGIEITPEAAKHAQRSVGRLPLASKGASKGRLN